MELPLHMLPLCWHLVIHYCLSIHCSHTSFRTRNQPQNPPKAPASEPPQTANCLPPSAGPAPGIHPTRLHGLHSASNFG